MERAEAGFEPMKTYIWRRNNTDAQYIDTRPLLDLCEAAERNQGERGGMRWWKQLGIDLEGARETSETEADRDGMEK